MTVCTTIGGMVMTVRWNGDDCVYNHRWNGNDCVHNPRWNGDLYTQYSDALLTVITIPHRVVHTVQ